MKLKTQTLSFQLLALTALLMGATGCPSSSSSADGDETGGSDGGDYVCDPVGDNAAVGELLNAPLADDAEVIQKEPQHPGDPGPDNLPE